MPILSIMYDTTRKNIWLQVFKRFIDFTRPVATTARSAETSSEEIRICTSSTLTNNDVYSGTSVSQISRTKSIQRNRGMPKNKTN